MKKTILLTGATDGIGQETAKLLVAEGHTVLLHGRSEEKLVKTKDILSRISGAGIIEAYRADLSKLAEVDALASAVAKNHSKIDVVINNAGVFSTPTPVTEEGYDIRFIVNTIAPYLLTTRLLPQLPTGSRVINLSSAAQSPVNFDAFAGKTRLSDNDAYAQSKLGITMWSFQLANELGNNGPSIMAVNPASMLGSNMVKEAYGVEGKGLDIGADILVRAALSDEFTNASGRYFDNDKGEFSNPHPDALSSDKNKKLVMAIVDVARALNVEISEIS